MMKGHSSAKRSVLKGLIEEVAIPLRKYDVSEAAAVKGSQFCTPQPRFRIPDPGIRIPDPGSRIPDPIPDNVATLASVAD